MASEKDLTVDERIMTVSGLMVSVEDEIAAIKSGDLKEAQGRLVMKGRSLQMKGIELYLQAARIEARLRPGLAKRMGDSRKVIEATGEKA